MERAGCPRGLYIQGVRPGDVVQIPATCSLANLGWCVAKASQEYLGALPLTTGSGVVTPVGARSRSRSTSAPMLELFSRILRARQVSRDEYGRDIRELKTK